MTDTAPLDTTTTADAKHDGAVRGRRITWAEFEKLTGRKRPDAANDNNAPPYFELRQRVLSGPPGSQAERGHVDEHPRRGQATGAGSKGPRAADPDRADPKAHIFPIENMRVR